MQPVPDFKRRQRDEAAKARVMLGELRRQMRRVERSPETDRLLGIADQGMGVVQHCLDGIIDGMSPYLADEPPDVPDAG